MRSQSRILIDYTTIIISMTTKKRSFSNLDKPVHGTALLTPLLDVSQYLKWSMTKTLTLESSSQPGHLPLALPPSEFCLQPLAFSSPPSSDSNTTPHPHRGIMKFCPGLYSFTPLPLYTNHVAPGP